MNQAVYIRIEDVAIEWSVNRKRAEISSASDCPKSFSLPRSAVVFPESLGTGRKLTPLATLPVYNTRPTSLTPSDGYRMVHFLSAAVAGPLLQAPQFQGDWAAQNAVHFALARRS